jgi:DNA-binding transcriptional LysR family regulator
MDWVGASRNFVTIVETGSFAEAARRRYTSSSALSKQISWLEDHHNIKLLHRTTRHLNLTAAGEAFYIKAKRILDHIDCLKASLQDDSSVLRGTLRVSCQMLAQQSHLLQLIPEFLAQHPHLRIELIVNPKPHDLAAEGIDLAIRTAFNPDSKLIQEKLGSMTIYVYGTKSYFEKHGTPKTPQDLLNHNCLDHMDLDKIWEFNDGSQITVSGNFTANSTAALIEAAKNGLGLTQMSDALVATYVLEGILVPVLQEYTKPCMGVYGVYEKQSYPNRNLEALIAFLKEHKFSSLFCRDGLPEK